MGALLEIENLTAGYPSKAYGKNVILHNIDLTVRAGEFWGIAGESGCGKSTLVNSVMKLNERLAVYEGSARFAGHGNLLERSPKEMEAIRWRDIAMVFQASMNVFSPVHTIYSQFMDIFRAHTDYSKSAAEDRMTELFQFVEIHPERLFAYPHQLSGGMKQRIVIAMSLALDPSLLIMDEPTTALDVVVQRSILEKIEDIRREKHFAIIFITHDLSLLTEISDFIVVMYAGIIMEIAPARDIYREPLHPYTMGMIDSFPPLVGELRRMEGIPGEPPKPGERHIGCPFVNRCDSARKRCVERVPELRDIGGGRKIACHFKAT